MNACPPLITAAVKAERGLLEQLEFYFNVLLVSGSHYKWTEYCEANDCDQGLHLL